MTRKMIDLTGQRFGRLTVIAKSDVIKSERIHWICRCDCGNITKPIAGASLRRGETKSCGCLRQMNFTKNSCQPEQKKEQPVPQRCYHPKGIQNLIEAFAKSVSRDIVSLPLDSTERQQSIKLLQSGYFEDLTGIDGNYLLERLLAERAERQKKKNYKPVQQKSVNDYAREYYWRKKKEAEELKKHANE